MHSLMAAVFHEANYRSCPAIRSFFVTHQFLCSSAQGSGGSGIGGGGGLSTAQIAGISVAGVVFAAISAVVVFYLCFQSRKDGSAKSSA
jgi:hypothetical protein